ncbi:MAG: hypothetical protein L0Y58_22395 [Verrucomicrobia subdivision 3 bacterium]|nr:hypothetical protein [Limisphaerales bacterium]
MATTYGEVEREVHQILANVAGGDVATVETNYVAVSSNTNRLNPDFAFTPVRDAVIESIIEILLAIADTPRYPQWPSYSDSSTNLSNGALRPTVDSLGNNIVGVWGQVEEFTTARPCLPAPLDRIRDYNLYSTTIYAGLDVYWWALDAEKIYHTRADGVRAYFCTLVRPVFNPTSFISLFDDQVPALVQGAVAKMAEKEGRYAALFTASSGLFQAHLAGIRAHGLLTGSETSIIPSAK